MKKILKAGLTDQTIDVFIQDSSSTTGQGLAGLLYNSASLSCHYRRGATGTATALTLATQTVGGAHSDGGFVEIHATNMKGMYRLDLSDAIVAAGATTVTLMLYGSANMAPVTIELQLVAIDLDDTVRLGLTALPNAAADAAGGLIISDAGGLDADAQRSDVAAILVDTGTTLDGRIPAALVGGRMDSSTGAMAANTLTASALATDAVAEIQSGLATSAALATAQTDLDTITGADGVIIATGTQTFNMTGNVTGNLSGSVGSVTAGVTVTTNNDKTGYRLSATGTDDILRSSLTEGYAADGATFTLEQGMYMLWSALQEFSIASTTITGKKLDGVTTSMTWTLDSSTSPTSRTRAT